VPLIWLFLAYLLHTTGEICLSPVGLSMITKLSAPKLVGLMMGVWFLSSALAHTLAGEIAKRTASETVGGVVIDPRAQLDTYIDVFQQIGLVGVGIGVVLLVLSPFLKKGMAGVN
jgi:POT family proton-dependent oligopeptide transporter